MELNGWSSPQMLRRYGASARSARARRTYDRIMQDRPCTSHDPVTGAPRRGTTSPGRGQKSTCANAPSAISAAAHCPRLTHMR